MPATLANSSTMQSRIDRGLRVARSRQRALVRAVEGPGRERDVLVQIAKSAGAAVVAWQVAKVALHSHQPFLAPLAALITVHATVYQSVRGAAQHVLAVLAGVLLAFLAARTLGVEWYSLGLVLVVALVIARWQRLGDSALQVPTTALLALTIAGGSTSRLVAAPMTPPTRVSTTRASSAVSWTPPAIVRASSAVVGTCRAESPSRCHRAMTRATTSTRPRLYHSTPSVRAARNASSTPARTASTCCAAPRTDW